ncbi:MAG: MgtC/SapB family protein [Stigonema ocellatum SAG 48.90 = DSM 106950]|nr:MgtC/SapB family protein [Stigonema ocellatum SAG 48.90 = DSM 106950]
MTWIDFTTQLGLAFFLGSVIGLERQWRQRMAGLQTNALVSTGAALFVMLSVLTSTDSNQNRVIAQIVSGIGFLGGGVILREGHGIRGLNTAATLWCTAAIGSLAGSGLYSEATIGAVMVLIVNTVLQPLAKKINHQSIHGTEVQLCYRCCVVCHNQHEPHVRALILEVVGVGVMKLRSLQIENIASSDQVEVEADFVAQDHKHELLELVVSRLSSEPKVSAVSWKLIEETHH